MRRRGGTIVEGLMKMQRVAEGKDVNGVVKNKNEAWSSVWSSLSPAALKSFQSMSKF